MSLEAGGHVGYTLLAANEKEDEPLAELVTNQTGTVIADKGFWGRSASSGFYVVAPSARLAACCQPSRQSF